MSRLLALIAIASLPSACAEHDMSDYANDTSVDDTDDTSVDLDSGDLYEDVTATYWSLDGVVQIDAEGGLIAAGSSLDLEYRGPDLEVLCAVTAQVVTAESLFFPLDVELVAWWELTLDAGEHECEWADGHDALRVGLGTLDPRLQEAMEAHDLDPAATSLYGLYTQASAGADVFVFGVGGTTEHYAGTSDTTTTPPLPEGVYTLQGLHLLPYE